MCHANYCRCKISAFLILHMYTDAIEYSVLLQKRPPTTTFSCSAPAIPMIDSLSVHENLPIVTRPITTHLILKMQFLVLSQSACQAIHSSPALATYIDCNNWTGFSPLHTSRELEYYIHHVQWQRLLWCGLSGEMKNKITRCAENKDSYYNEDSHYGFRLKEVYRIPTSQVWRPMNLYHRVIVILPNQNNSYWPRYFPMSCMPSQFKAYVYKLDNSIGPIIILLIRVSKLIK